MKPKSKNIKFLFTILINIVTIPVESLFLNFFDLARAEVGIYIIWVRVLSVFNALFNTRRKNIFAEDLI